MLNMALGRSIREFGVLPDKSASENRTRLQEAIDWSAEYGAALFVEPSLDPYPVDGGLILRRNASLIGVHGPVGRGTAHPTKAQPVGSVFSIEDEDEAFLTVEGGTQIRGVQFWYPGQTDTDPGKVIEYPTTIRASQDKARPAQGVTLSSLTFYGEFTAFDFRTPTAPCELMNFEHCVGYPLSGQFILIDRCYDIPRLLHCHVNPSNQRLFKGRGFSRAVNDSVIARKTFCYDIENTDNAQLIDVFAFAVYGGIRLGASTYGQLTNFNLDCLTVGIHKLGDNTFNRNWQIAQGAIIANAGERVEDIHPIVIEGKGHTALTNVEAFSGPNGALTTLNISQDFLRVQGDDALTVSLFGCRMRNYASEDPITIGNPHAIVRATACIDKYEQPYSR